MGLASGSRCPRLLQGVRYPFRRASCCADRVVVIWVGDGGVERVVKELDDAYDELVAEARRRGEKSGERVSDDVAVARFLRTPQGRSAYAAYIEGRGRVATAVQKSSEDEARRQHVEIVSERFLEDVRKAVAGGEDREDAVIRLFDTNVAQALGLDLVRKSAGDDAHAPIERAARRLMQADPSLSWSQACALAVDRDPKLYDAYVAKMGRIQYEATNPALNRPDDGGQTALGSVALNVFGTPKVPL